MSVLGVTMLAWDLEHQDGLLTEFDAHPDQVLARYRLTDLERAAIRGRDAATLIAGEVNPVVVRNLFVIQGIAHRNMFAQPAAETDGDHTPQDGIR